MLALLCPLVVYAVEVDGVAHGVVMEEEQTR